MGIEPILERIVNRLQGTEGLQAIVLGGSRVTNTHRPDSDIDIGLYYEGENGLDIAGLSQVATELDDQHRSGLMTGIGEWGRGQWRRLARHRRISRRLIVPGYDGCPKGS